MSTYTFSRLTSYAGSSLLHALRDWAFLLFVIALPTTMYLFFAGIYGDQPTEGGHKLEALMMVTMAAYGGLGAAMSAGAQIQVERTTGWFRQLMLTPLRPAEFFGIRALVAAGTVLPAIGAVFVCGALRGVSVSAATWASCLGMLLVSLLPMTILGIVLGIWLKPQTANAATTLTLLALSMVGGLWFPLDMMPSAMQFIGRLLPSYWAGQLGTWPIVQGDFPWQGAINILVWTVSLAILGLLGYRRAIVNSRR